MKKRTLSFLIVALFSVLLAGCTEVNQEITAESEGFWNEYVIYPLSQFITATSDLVGGYGLGIIVVTIIIRIIILPLMIKQTKSAKAMQEIQPEIKKIQEKYKSKDAQTQQKLQQETMALFQKHGVNPLAGCFPILVQMPIIIGLYQAIMRTGEIKNHTFLWFDLGSPDIILSVLAGVFTFFQQKLMMAGPASDNPQMKMMLYLMPIMIIVFGITLPSALALYWVVGSIFMIIQTLIIGRNKPVQDAGL
ncbi:YidC family membrane integrase SpoIIIJ [Domibacillus indicus]|uniref:YidC family membrane integrase SpoIIIJ n=1 Tax=Domibacillus TaxID=1433999 RepID=UPI001F5A7011|nr:MULTISPECIES: YidC family membrane integrase SpoIIIJ [Domibacillus]MCI2253555.1 YidC family membrane integrase SpoIIIJ [Domibacillus sp. PGB-M46]MCM3788532.1 YidC family membrane integrase SpoIIIJ [Domibacillus indicus]